METMNQQSTISKKVPAIESLSLLAFAAVLFDSLFTYYLSTAGYFVPVNSILILLLIGLIVLSKGRSLTMAITPAVLLFIAIMSFIVGIVLNPQVENVRVLKLGAAICAFFIGISCARNLNNVDRFADLCLLIGIAYCITCSLALLKLLPSVFPLTLSLGFNNGVQVVRPEVTTDQNFQILYLLPSILVIALPFQLKRFLLTLCCISLSFFVLTQLKTRSGLLVFVGTLLLCLSAPILSNTLGGKKKSILIPILILIVFMLFFPAIAGFSTGAIDRFAGSYHTFHGRILSISYLFQHLFSPEWWLPMGNSEFIEATGNLPHSNVTAFFLEGGLTGLLAWVGLFFIPLMRLCVAFFKKKLSSLHTILTIGGLSAMITQLSLNAPLHEHIWLWGGICVGLCMRLSTKKRYRRLTR